jgi:sulfide:quinone oxidoreductase
MCSSDLFAPSGFLKVDADYTPKPAGEWRAEDWPQTYQSPRTRARSGSALRSPRRTLSPPCIASAGAGLRTGTAAAMTMYPVVPDYTRFPVHGRSVTDTYGEIGLAAHWVKHLLHFVFIYKAKARPGWAFLPE